MGNESESDVIFGFRNMEYETTQYHNRGWPETGFGGSISYRVKH